MFQKSTTNIEMMVATDAAAWGCLKSTAQQTALVGVNFLCWRISCLRACLCPKRAACCWLGLYISLG